ncbi:MAG: hypothetical protein AAB262_01320, partial [Elusimicrobiota bacterium]
MSLVLADLRPVLAAGLDAASARPRADAWRSVLASFPSGAPIPFLQPFGLSAPGQVESFLRVAVRADLTPSAELTPQGVRAAVAVYAGALAQRVRESGAAASAAELSELGLAFDDLPTLSVISPESGAGLEHARRAFTQVMAAATAEERAAVERSIEAARRAWEGRDGASPVRALPAGAFGAVDPSWRLKKAQTPPSARVAAAIPAPFALPPRLAAPDKAATVLGPETHAALQELGLAGYARFQRLARAQVAFERAALEAEPTLKQAVFSMRAQERFSQTVLALTPRLRRQGSKQPLAEALILAAQHAYGDALPAGARRLLGPLSEFIPRKAVADLDTSRLEQAVLGIPVADDDISRRAAHALMTSHPVLFQEPAGADGALMAALTRHARALGAQLSTLYAHPFTDDRQLLGHKVPAAGGGRLVFGVGALVRLARRAERELKAARQAGRKPRRFLLLIKNVEALEPGVPTGLQEALRIGELTHPDLGTVRLPANLQILMTMRAGAAVEDDSFFDRVIVKLLPAPPAARFREALSWPAGVTESNYLEHVSLGARGGRSVLALPGAEIELSEEFRGLTPKNLHDEIYLKTGLVLDFGTVRQLSAMAQAQKSRAPILRVEGPTGLGKTFTAAGYARLRGRPFFSNPVNADTSLSDWIGGFEQDASGAFGFNADTPFKRRLEEGGVVALSELNTLLDHHEKASLGWWLAQVAEAEPDASGYRTIPLGEVPVPEGESVPVIRIHPESLIIVDTNPQGEYAARGALPEILDERAPLLRLEPLVAPGADADQRAREKRRLVFFADMFLRHDWIARGRTLGRAILDAERRARLAARLAEAYHAAASRIKPEETAGQRILSTRELKRMAQDLLVEADAALDAVADAHLEAFRGEPSVLRARLGPFVRDQLLAKGRPVHLRLGPGADARREVEEALLRDPAVELEFVSATEETDRFQMEGGLIPSRDGTRLEFGPGIFARMIEKARARPERKVVFVFDNAHNLRPEQVVALNEFLQEGRLYPKGASRAYELPPNAFVLFVSRSDSPLSWSPAERSRFVEYAALSVDAQAERAVMEELAAVLRALPKELAGPLGRWAAGAYARWSADSSAAPAGTVSVRRRRWFLDGLRAAVEQTLNAGLGVAELGAELTRSFADVLLASTPAPQRQAALERYMRPLKLLSQVYERALDRGPKVEDGPGLDLPRARLLFSQATTQAQRVQALAALSRAAAAAPADVWDKRPAAQLSEWDVARALLPGEALKVVGPVSSVAMTSDRGVIVLGGPGGGVVFRRDAAGRYAAAEPAIPDAVRSVAVTPDGRVIVMGDQVFRDGRRHALPLPEGFDGEKITAVTITPDGRTLVIAGLFGQHVLGWDDAQGYIFTQSLYVKHVVSASAVTSDGRTIVLGGWSGPSVFRDGRQLALSGPEFLSARTGAVALTPDGKTLVVGLRPGGAAVWVWNEAAQAYLAGPELSSIDAIRALAVTPDG